MRHIPGSNVGNPTFQVFYQVNADVGYKRGSVVRLRGIVFKSEFTPIRKINKIAGGLLSQNTKICQQAKFGYPYPLPLYSTTKLR